MRELQTILVVSALLFAPSALGGDDLAAADAAYRAHRWDEAERLYQRLVAAGTQTPRAYVNLGAIWDDERRGGGFVARSEELYRSALRIDPGSGAAWYRLGLHLYGEGKRSEAIDALRHATAIEGEHAADACYRLARLLAGGSEYAEVERLLRRSIALSPRTPAPYFHLGRALANQGRKKEALAVLRQGMALPRGDEPLNFEDEIREMEE